MTDVHASHSDIQNRLRRANGHLQKIIEMIDEGRPCLDVAQQLQAVYKAIGNAKGVFVQDHIEGCLSGDTNSPTELKTMMKEIREIAKYL
jgi:DNA-binding FrmR family transcriptional regulator